MIPGSHWLNNADSAKPHDVPILLYCLFLLPNLDSDVYVGLFYSCLQIKLK